MIRDDQSDQNDSLRDFLEAGFDMTGGVTGAGIGLLVGGPAGAIAGAASGPVVTRMLRAGALEFMHRSLSRRQKARVSGALLVAASRIQERLNQGDIFENQEFFEPLESGRSNAEEIAEGILISAQQEHEEKKVAFMGNLLANIAFDYRISRHQANFFVRLLDRLSYRQLCILAGISNRDYADITFRQRLFESTEFLTNEDHPGFVYDLWELYNYGLIGFGEGGSNSFLGGGRERDAFLDIGVADLTMIGLSTLGSDFAYFSSLFKADREDVLAALYMMVPDQVLREKRLHRLSKDH